MKRVFGSPLFATAAGLLLLLPVGLLLRWSTFRITFDISLEERALELVMNGTKLRAELPEVPKAFEAITLREARSFYPLGLESVVVLGPDGSSTPVSLEPVVEVNPPALAPLVGDWWVDRYPQVRDVARAPLKLATPTRLRVTLTGRSFQNREIWLEGPQRVGFIGRSGLLNNDLLLLVGDRVVAGSAQGVGREIDARHLAHTVLLGLAGALVLALVAGPRRDRPPAASPRLWTALTVLALAAGAGLTLWMGLSVLDGRPHFQDDLGYLVRARWLTEARLTGPVLNPMEHFQIPYTACVEGRQISQYPIGWPLVLAAGALLGAPGAVAPLCAAVAAICAALVGRRLGGPVVGLVTALLLATSPLHQILGGSMLAHAAAGMWLALFVCLFLRGWDPEHGRPWHLAAAALALGGLFCTRPLTALAAALPAAAWTLWKVIQSRFSGKSMFAALLMLPAGLLGSAPALLDNWAVTGNPFKFAYRITLNSNWTLSAWPEGLFWLDRTAAQLPTLLFGWGWPTVRGTGWILALSLGVLLLRFVLGRAAAADWLILATCLTLSLSYIGYVGGTGLHGFGPRYLAEAVPLLAILGARGLQALAEGRSRLLAQSLVAALLLPAAVFLPGRLAQYRGYNDVSNILEQAVATAKVERGLIILGEPIHLNWMRAARWVPPHPDDPVVVAESREDNTRLLRVFRDRPVYLFKDDRLGPYVPEQK